jgi:hypothetical protein
MPSKANVDFNDVMNALLYGLGSRGDAFQLRAPAEKV